jgi:LCP family protein required for cell wall assembly
MSTHRPNSKVRKRVYLFLAAVALLMIGFLAFEFARYIPTLYQFFFQKEIELKKTADQRVNVLLLGIGGGKHDGPLLTDTIIFASIDPESKKLTLVSVPRDFWVPDLKAKINTAYSTGESKRKGSGGLLLTKAVVSKILGQDIDYAVRVDFNGFVKAVDMVGGLDIDVERAFDDNEYPLSGKETDNCGYEGEEFEKRATEEAQLEAFPCRYEKLHFERGLQHMDGETALKFVRSRHGNNNEGTDFSRSKRQEKVILAFREKVFSAGTLLNPVKVISLYSTFKDSIDTDITLTEIDDFIKLSRKLEDANITSSVLDYGDDATDRPGLLINPPPSKSYGFQWVIIPRTGEENFKEIQEFVACQIRSGNCEITPTQDPSAL